MDKRKKLLELIEKQNIPLPPVEAKEHLEKLSDEEVELLISTYTDLKGAEDAIEEVLKDTEPKEYRSLKDEYGQKIKVDEKGSKKDLEEINTKAEDEIEEIEDEIVKDARKLAEEINEEVNEIEKQGNEVLKISEESLQ